MAGWLHQLNGHEFEQTPGHSEGQGSLACCSSWGRKELDVPEQLNSNKPTTLGIAETYLVAHMIKNLPSVQETWVLSLGWEDPLKKGMAIHSSILPWRIPWTEKPGRLYRSWVCKELDTTEQLN